MKHTAAVSALPLGRVRVLDLTSGVGRLTARFLADLGADVVRVTLEGDPPQDRYVDVTHNANKRGIRVGSDPADRELLRRLVTASDLVVEDRPPGALAAYGIAFDDLRQSVPHLVVVSVTDFGQTGPYRTWVGTEQVHLALGGVLSRSGLPDGAPLIPPGEMAGASAALQAAWVALVALYRATGTGLGDDIDLSVYESTVLSFDAPFGIGGTAAAGAHALDGPRGRPDARHLYPIFPCADGYVRLCVLSPRQWQGLLRWLGDPPELADPDLAKLPARHRARNLIADVVAVAFRGKPRAQIVAEAREHGVPAGAVHRPAEVFQAEQFIAHHSFLRVRDTYGSEVAVANSPIEFDRTRITSLRPAPTPDEHRAEIVAELETGRVGVTGSTAPGRPLEGIRVLDLGVIVVGAEVGRLLADMGAEVIKIENSAYPDGSRQAARQGGMSASLACGHRNKLGLGLNLRDQRGVELFRNLVRRSDVVLANFKPGTLESLGIGCETLTADNPAIIVAESSAYGSNGPWSRRMGYGPLIRSETGVTGLWRYPDDETGFSDASTIYPDHIAARVIAAGVVAKLIERRTSGCGGHISVAQAEVILYQHAAAFARESVHPGSMIPTGNDLDGDAPRGVYPCAGDDEWVVVTARDDGDWSAVAKVIGRPELAFDARFSSSAGRVRLRAEIDELVRGWTTTQPPRVAMETLQGAGVPAGMMQRPLDLLDDPHLRQRGLLRTATHPLVGASFPVEARPAVMASTSPPDERPAPLLGEHTRQICRGLLGMSDDAIDGLLRDGVLEDPTG